MMFYIEDHINKIEGVKSITEPWNSKTTGKWLVNTDIQHFHPVGVSLCTQFSDWIQTHVPPNELPSATFQDCHPPDVHFTSFGPASGPNDTDVLDASTVASAKSYKSQALSYYTTLYDNHAADTDNYYSTPAAPQEITIPSVRTYCQSWASVATTNHSTAGSPNEPSDLTSASELPTGGHQSRTDDIVSSLQAELARTKLELQKARQQGSQPENSPAITETDNTSLRQQIQQMKSQHEHLATMLENQQRVMVLLANAISQTDTNAPAGKLNLLPDLLLQAQPPDLCAPPNPAIFTTPT